MMEMSLAMESTVITYFIMIVSRCGFKSNHPVHVVDLPFRNLLQVVRKKKCKKMTMYMIHMERNDCGYTSSGQWLSVALLNFLSISVMEIKNDNHRFSLWFYCNSWFLNCFNTYSTLVQTIVSLEGTEITIHLSIQYWYWKIYRVLLVIVSFSLLSTTVIVGLIPGNSTGIGSSRHDQQECWVTRNMTSPDGRIGVCCPILVQSPAKKQELYQC